MLWRNVINVRCINCSYNNVTTGIRLLDKKAIFVYRKKIMQVRAFERYIPLIDVSMLIDENIYQIYIYQPTFTIERIEILPPFVMLVNYILKYFRKCQIIIYMQISYMINILT